MNRLMSIKRRFIFITLLILLISISVIIYLNIHVFLTSTICPNSYLASYMDKKELLENTVAPRILFVGDSAFVHSLNSQQVKDELKRNPINIGTLGGIGLRFSLESTKPYIQTGDIIVIGVSFGHWITPHSFDSSVNKNFLWQILVMSPDDIKYLTSVQQISYVLQANYQVLLERIRENTLFSLPGCIETGKGKSRSEFNEYGDFIGHLSVGTLNRTFTKDQYTLLDINPELYDEVNEFSDYAYQQGASVYYMSVAYANSFYEVNQTVADMFMPALRKNLNFPVLGEIKDFVLADSYFYDSPEHATAEGREIYTFKLIDILGPLIDSDS